MLLRGNLSQQEKEIEGKLLEFWLEIWPYCHLHCSFCFNSAGEFSGNGLLPTEEYLKILSEFKQMGGRVVAIPGFGEPLHPKNSELTFKILDFANRLKLRTILFTAGDLINEEIIRRLNATNTSVMMKFNSFRDDVQDSLVGKKDYARKRNQAIKLLVEAGFTRDEETRLAFVTSILKENEFEIPDIFRYCLKNNIYPDIDTLLSLGRGCDCDQVENEKTKNIFGELRKISKDEFGYQWEISPTYVGGKCTRYRNHLYMDCFGNVSPCLGANKRGIFLAKNSLSEAWNHPLQKKIRARDYSGKCTKCQSFQKQTCNSCLGRFAETITVEEIKTIGCWNFSE